MSRYNAQFQHKSLGVLSKGSNGFLTQNNSGEWIKGCHCYVEKMIPAKQRIGTDGQVFTYSYEVYIPKHYKGIIELNAQFSITMEDGSTDDFTVSGIDNLNRRSIIVWG